MPTDNYTNSASSYKALFSNQARVNSPATITGTEQFDRDNLLHFVEDNFKTNKKGGVILKNLRAFFHVLIKSVSVVSDDNNLVVIAQRSGQITTTNSGRHYFGNASGGYNSTVWSSYTATLPDFRSSESNSAIRTPFVLAHPTVIGTVLRTGTDTGDVTASVYYTDQDDTTNAFVQNGVLIGTAVIPCAISATSYNFSITANMKVPADKMVFISFENTGYTSGTELLNVTACLYGNEHSLNWSTT